LLRNFKTERDTFGISRGLWAWSVAFNRLELLWLQNGLSPSPKWDCDKTIACQFRRRHSFRSGSSVWNPFTHMMYRLKFQLGVKRYGQATVVTISGPYQPWNMGVSLKMGEPYTPNGPSNRKWWLSVGFCGTLQLWPCITYKY
jgi:hypothetical protein